LLGAEAAGALLRTIAGVLMALFMSHVGATLGNAKKYVEAGHWVARVRRVTPQLS
jgi:Na+/H+-translocating membrane pyrophosphatase